MSNPLARSRVAEAAVARYTIVKSGVGVNSCTPAVAATDHLLGTSDELAHVVGDLVDVGTGSRHSVKLGGTVAAGDALTSDANGNAIATTTVGNRIIGFAENAGVVGDEIAYLRSLGVV